MGLFSKSKKSSEEPATAIHSANDNPAPIIDGKPRKKSLYQKYQNLKRGPGTSGLSEEDLKKYTGMSRAELNKFAMTTPGVAGRQAAGSITAGGTSGFGMSAGTGEGLHGWGTGAGKDNVIR